MLLDCRQAAKSLLQAATTMSSWRKECHLCFDGSLQLSMVSVCVWWQSHDKWGWTLWGLHWQLPNTTWIYCDKFVFRYRCHSTVWSSMSSDDGDPCWLPTASVLVGSSWATLPSSDSYSQHPNHPRVFHTLGRWGYGYWLTLATASEDCSLQAASSHTEGDSYRLQSLQRLNKSPHSA